MDYKKLKDFVLSSFLSLGKAEQQILKDILKETDDTQYEQQVQKDHIKIVSKKRFYEILDRADEFMTEKDLYRLKTLMEQRGLTEDIKTFKNQVYVDILNNADHKFKTDNGLFQYADTVQIKNIEEGQELSFFINVKEHPEIVQHYNLLSNLGFFKLEENRAKYSYKIYQFLGMEKVTPFEVVLKYLGEVEENGIKPIYEDEERIMRRCDLLNQGNKNTYQLGSKDFIVE